MVLRTRTSCSFKWRACMELRCACRSTNIPETSRFELSIRYIRRLMAISSTENAQRGVLTPAGSVQLSIGLNHVALPKIDRARNNLFRIYPGCRPGPGGGPDRRLARGRWCCQHPRRAMQREHVGRGGLGKNARGARQKQSGCVEAKPAVTGHGDLDRHEEESRRRSMGRPGL